MAKQKINAELPLASNGVVIGIAADGYIGDIIITPTGEATILGTKNNNTVVAIDHKRREYGYLDGGQVEWLADAVWLKDSPHLDLSQPRFI